MVVLLFLLTCVGHVFGFLFPESCDTVECKLDSVVQIVTKQQTLIDHQSRQIVALEQQLSAVHGMQTTIPSFYAVKSRDQGDLAKGERIVFDSTITNVFKAYDIYSGVFKVPLKGAYAFTWSIAMNNIDNHACFSLFVNDIVVGQTYLWNNGSDAVSTGFSIVEVNSGDDVYINLCNVSQPLGEIVSDMYRKTSFAGWCIACA